MGVTVVGLDELIHDLERVQSDGPPKFRKVVAKGARNIKVEWKRRWLPRIGGGAMNLPHIVRGIGYDTDETATTFSAEIGVSRTNSQAPLAHFPEYGSIKNAPNPGGLPSLLEEEPRFVRAVADAAVDLLEGR